jgi:hypothetical protein
MIEMNLGSLVIADNALDQLLEMKFSAKTAYHIAKLARLVKEEVRHFNDKRDSLIRELGEMNGNNTMKVKPENMEEFVKQINELASVKIEVNWKPIPLDEISGNEITGSILLKLDSLVSD